MRRILVPVAAAALLTVGGAGVAFATGTHTGGNAPSSHISIITSCGSVTIKFKAPVYGDKHAAGDWWVGKESDASNPQHAESWTGQTIAQGPAAGREFPTYHNVVPINEKIKDGVGHGTAGPITFDEDANGGTVVVHARIMEGPEQQDFVTPVHKTVKTNCKADTTTPTTPPATTSTTPPATQPSTPTTSNTQGGAVPTTQQNSNGNGNQVSKTPVGAVDTGYGSTAGVEDAWLYGLGGAVVLAGAGLGLIAARRRKSHQQ